MRRLLLPFLAAASLLACSGQSALPAGVALGDSLASARPRIAAACRRVEVLHYTGAEAAPAREEQTQIDCYGVNFYGASRKVEFMFNDGTLAFLWILMEPSESERIHREIVSARGASIYQHGGYEVFRGGELAFRNDPHEVLIANPAMMTEITGYRP